MIKIKGKTYAGADHKEGTIQWLKQSTENQREYLKAAIEDNSDMPEVILMAIREIAEARGYENFANDAGLSKKSLYRILDEEKEAKPRYETIYQLIHALGLRFTVEADPAAKVG
ncbi:MAG: putative addiction module antidote protein [Bdellovibrionales bacterium]|nr:putative addiction module antidote protein [Bdellovibrionales bacterium]